MNVALPAEMVTRPAFNHGSGGVSMEVFDGGHNGVFDSDEPEHN